MARGLVALSNTTENNDFALSTFTFDATALPTGRNTIEVRVQNSGVWSTASIHSIGQQCRTIAETITLDRAEYFNDSDAGAEQRIGFEDSGVTTLFDGRILMAEQTINVNQSVGAHTMGVLGACIRWHLGPNHH